MFTLYDRRDSSGNPLAGPVRARDIGEVVVEIEGGEMLLSGEPTPVPKLKQKRIQLLALTDPTVARLLVGSLF
jgi:hypothetical protein